MLIRWFYNGVKSKQTLLEVRSGAASGANLVPFCFNEKLYENQVP